MGVDNIALDLEQFLAAADAGAGLAKILFCASAPVVIADTVVPFWTTDPVTAYFG